MVLTVPVMLCFVLGIDDYTHIITYIFSIYNLNQTKRSKTFRKMLYP